MVYGNDLNLVFANAVDQTIVVQNDLPNVLDVQSRHYSPGAWMVYESVCGTEGSVGEHCSYLGRVPGNEKTNRLKIIESLGDTLVDRSDLEAFAAPTPLADLEARGP